MRRSAAAWTWLVGGLVAAIVLAGCSAVTAPEPVGEAAPSVEPAPAPEPAPPPEPPSEPAEPEPAPPEESAPALRAFGVSAGDADAVAAGMAVLEDGGNAVDAAVAAAFAVSVVEPFASGIGGGGAAIVAAPGTEPVAYDYREVVSQDGVIPATNIGIPGFVAGMGALLDDHGTRTLGEVLAPAVDLARHGTATSATVASQLRSAAYRLPVGQLPHLYPGGAPLDAGAPLVQEELADTLELLARDGVDAFYRGALANRLAVNVDGIDRASLEAYAVQRSRPPAGRVGDLEVLGAAPPLPGATLIQMLQVAEALDIGAIEPGSADHIHTISMAWRLADQFVSWDLGDPAFIDVPLDELTDPERNTALAAEVPPNGFLSVDPGQPRGGLTGNTTHLTVVDADGMMVSMTNTITNFWGSGRYEAGFFLNDQLRRFSIGRSAANRPEPGRRSVSWALPAMVLDDEGRPVLGIGSPGGRRIPNILTQVLVRWGFHDQSLSDAVAATRFHLEGTELFVEEIPPAPIADDLRGRGYSALSVPGPPYYFGSVQALVVDHDSGEVTGARDTRREGDWAVGTP